MAIRNDETPEDFCPVCGYYCTGKGGAYCINKSQMFNQIALKVYLAGGMNGDWQDKIKSSISGTSNIIYFDPRDHGLTDPKDYTKWDLEHVAKSDLVFAYFESSNPSGFGMSIEMGYAAALKIPIILVDEKQLGSWAMAHHICESVCDDLNKGIEYFIRFIRTRSISPSTSE